MDITLDVNVTTEEIYNLIIGLENYFTETSATELHITGIRLTKYLETLLDLLGYTTKYDSCNSFFISKHQELKV